jgi:hypothetical protein
MSAPAGMVESERGLHMKCPNCESSEHVREVLYGMPAEEPDPAKYLVGGCCMEADSPDFKCLSCGWQHQTQISSILGKHLREGVKLFKEKAN